MRTALLVIIMIMLLLCISFSALRMQESYSLRYQESYSLRYQAYLVHYKKWLARDVIGVLPEDCNNGKVV